VKLKPLHSNYNIVEIHERHSRLYRCHHKGKECLGLYIRSRINQTKCLHCHTKEELKELTPKWKVSKAPTRSHSISEVSMSGELLVEYTGIEILE
jgi:hypothetical protein